MGLPSDSESAGKGALDRGIEGSTEIQSNAIKIVVLCCSIMLHYIP
jgi:hypothetical protein